jgi:Magnesium chelatase, subunit ChlI
MRWGPALRIRLEMLAHRLTMILQAMTSAEAIETTRIRRIAGHTDARTTVVTSRPFRAKRFTLMCRPRQELRRQLVQQELRD